MLYSFKMYFFIVELFCSNYTFLYIIVKYKCVKMCGDQWTHLRVFGELYEYLRNMVELFK
jgi:hypothetical protein